MITKEDVELIKGYVAYKQATGKHLSEQRARNIQIILTYWQKYIKTPYTSANSEQIVMAIGAFKQSKTDKGEPYSQNTQNTYITVLKGFLFWLVDKECSKITIKEIKAITPPSMDKHTTAPNDILTADDVHKMLKITFNPMHRALLALSWEAGARPAEINALQWSDLTADQYGYKLWITDTKTSKRRFVRLTMAAPYISEWKKATPKNSPTDYIFIGRYDEPLTYDGTAKTIARIEKKVNISKKVHLYSFRKGRINDMIKTRMPDSAIKEQIWNNQGTQMLDVYLSLNDGDIDDMVLAHNGIKKEDNVIVNPLAPITCVNCHTVNECDSLFCKKCGFALTEEVKDKLADAKGEIHKSEEYDSKLEILGLKEQLKKLEKIVMAKS